MRTSPILILNSIEFSFFIIYANGYYNLKIKQFLYRTGHVLRVPGGWGSQISRQTAHEDGKFVSPTHWSPLLSPRKEISLAHFSIRDRVDPKSIVEPEGLWQ